MLTLFSSNLTKKWRDLIKANNAVYAYDDCYGNISEIFAAEPHWTEEYRGLTENAGRKHAGRYFLTFGVKSESN